MNNFIVWTFLFLSFAGITQDEMGQSSSSPEECITSFFKAFHAQDTVALKEVIHKDIVLATVNTASKDTSLVTDSIKQFYT